jgi:branched-subunit amino acid aminotransferase/4-amino-4-deoxychorismate lyase
MNLVYLNGSYLTLEEARLPITDRGFTYGDGVFTTLKVSEGSRSFWRSISRASPETRRL